MWETNRGPRRAGRIVRAQRKPQLERGAGRSKFSKHLDALCMLNGGTTAAHLWRASRLNSLVRALDVSTQPFHRLLRAFSQF